MSTSITGRIGGTANAYPIDRMPRSLLLSGDMTDGDDRLLLSGDMSNGDDALMLSGDAATTLTTIITNP